MATYDSTLYGGAANLGKRFKASNGVVSDVRGYVNWTELFTDPFTDSMGLTVDRIDGSVLVAGLELGFEKQFDENLSGYGRVGGKLTDFNGSLESSGTAVQFGGDYIAATFEAGIEDKFSENATVSLAGFAEVSGDSSVYGGRLTFGVKF